MKLCKVCSIVVPWRRHCFQATCEACQRFFRRNVDRRSELSCIVGDSKCVIDGTTRRFCSKCRFEKCLTAGLQTKSLAIAKRKETSREIVLKYDPEPGPVDGAALERTFQITSKAYTELHDCLSLPLSVGNHATTSISRRQRMSIAFHHIYETAEIALRYCRFMSEEECLTPFETRMLTKEFASRASLVFSRLAANYHACFFGINQAYKDVILNDWPGFTLSWQLAEKLDAILTEWEPTFVETAILLAMLFFEEKSASNPRIYNIRERLRLTFIVYLTKTLGSNQLALDRYSNYLLRVLNLVNCICSSANEDIMSMAEKEPTFARWPLEISKLNDKVVAEVEITEI